MKKSTDVSDRCFYKFDGTFLQLFTARIFPLISKPANYHKLMRFLWNIGKTALNNPLNVGDCLDCMPAFLIVTFGVVYLH